MPKLTTTYSLEQSPFYRLGRKKDLAALLGITEAELKAIARQHDAVSFYEFDLEKGSKKRHIEVPQGVIKPLHKRIKNLLSRITPPDFLYCPVKGRSYITNALQHRESKVVVNMDIKNYFPSSKASRVYEFFHKNMQCSKDVAWAITQICTCNGHVPTGSTLSPILSFLAHYTMWQRIALLCKEAGCVLTVYVDDLTISGDSVSERLIWNIKQEIHRTGLEYHSGKKLKRYEGNMPKLITGVIIHNGKPHLPNRQHQKIRSLRQQLQTCNDFAERHKLSQSLTGLLSQQRQIAMCV